MISIDPVSLQPMISLECPAWFRVPLGVSRDLLHEWARVSAAAAAAERDQPTGVESAAQTLFAQGERPVGDGVSVRLVFLPDLTGAGMSYDVLALDPAGGPDDARAAHRLLIGADDVAAGCLLDITGPESDNVIGLQVFDVIDSEPIPIGGGSTIVPIAFSRCVIRRLTSPIGIVDLLAAGAAADVELAAFSLAPLHQLLLGDQLFA